MRRVLIIVVFCVFCVSNSFAQEEKKPDSIKEFYLKKGKGFEFHFDKDSYMFYILTLEVSSERLILHITSRPVRMILAMMI